jgi:galactokinase
MNAALQAGALGAKIIGSGGGGAMVAIAEEHTKENIIQAFKTAGAHDAYEVKLAIH